MGQSDQFLYSRSGRPQQNVFTPWKNDNRLYVAQVTEVRWEPNEKRYTADVVIVNAKNQKWQNCPILTHGAGFDRGHVWMPRPEELVLCAFAESMFASPVILGSLYMDKWRLPYPPRSYMRDRHAGLDATDTFGAEQAKYENRRFGEHWRHMPRGAFWTVNRLGIYRISDRYEADPLLRGDGATYSYHQDRHFSAGSEFLELDPKKQHTRLYGRRSVIITSTKSGLGSGHIINKNHAKEPDLHVTFALDDTRPKHSEVIRPQGRSTWPEMDEGQGFQQCSNPWELEPVQGYIPIGTSRNEPHKDREPKPITTSTPCQGEECDHDGCVHVRGAKDVHIEYCRYFRQESWVPEVIDPPCDPAVQPKVLSSCMAAEVYPPKSGQHLSGRNRDGGYLNDTGKGDQRTRTDGRQRHYSKKSYTISTPSTLFLSGNPTIICNPVLGCANAAVPRIEAVNPSAKL